MINSSEFDLSVTPWAVLPEKSSIQSLAEEICRIASSSDLQRIRFLSEWENLSTLNPDVLSRICQEYDRVNGFVPYKQGYVYMIQAVGTNYYKIGKSIKPDRRILEIAPQMPFPTSFVKIWKSNFMSTAEVWMHNHFAEFRTNGEWFELSDETLESILDDYQDDYSRQILNAYGQLFWQKVMPYADGLTYMEKAKVGAIDVTDDLWCVTPASIALIEELFLDIDKNSRFEID